MNRLKITQHNPVLWEIQQLGPLLKPLNSKVEGLVEIFVGIDLIRHDILLSNWRCGTKSPYTHIHIYEWLGCYGL